MPSPERSPVSSEAGPSPDDPRFDVLFLLGTAHCGSTLLGRMLGMHTDVLCVGEVMRMEDARAKGFSCSCGASFDDCPFWGPRRELFLRYGEDHRRLDLTFFRELARGAGRKLVFDTSKTRVWRTRRAWGGGVARKRAGFVLLLRDSRGVLAAAKRDGHDLDHVAPRHGKWIRRLVRFSEKQRERALVLSYEGLCRDPEETLRRVAEHAGLSWQDEILRPADQVHHLVHASASRFLPGSNEVRRDERWRAELTAGEVARIEREMARVPALRERYLEAGSPAYLLG